jgi:alkylation response protein AidB-like acyl-CoA dehydrogenase
MDFAESGQLQDVRQRAREFAEVMLAPGVARRDEAEIFERSLFAAAGESGLAGLTVAKADGGTDAGYQVNAVMVEEIARVCAAMGDTLSAHTTLGTWPLVQAGTEAQKKAYLPKLARGEWMSAFCLTEACAGSDVAAMAATAVQDGAGWVLNGEKIYITNAIEAELYIIFARTSDDPRRGISTFLVEKGTPGLSFGKPMRKMGIRSTVNAPVCLEDCRIPTAQLLGEVGQGLDLALEALDGGRTGIAAQAVGIGRNAIELATDQSRQRIQFGKPIARQQGIQFKLAEMAMRLEAARLMTYKAGWLQDQGKPYRTAAAMAKCSAGDAAVYLAGEALQIFGGCGYSRDLPLERLYRDAKITQIYEGTNEIQRLVIASGVLKDGYA